MHSNSDLWRSQSYYRSQPTIMKNVRLPSSTCHYHSKEAFASSSWKEWSLTRKRSKQNLMDTNEIDPIIQEHMTVVPCYFQTEAHHHSFTDPSASEHRPEVILTPPMTPPPSHHHRFYSRPASQETTPSPQRLRAGKSRRLNPQHYHSYGDSRHHYDSSGSSIQFWNHLSAITGNAHMKPYKLTH
jgi:hypothetical protein